MEQSFGEFLSLKRKEANLTQKQLADKLFVSPSAVSKWEKNVAYPELSIVTKLCNILGITEHELLTASEDRHLQEIKSNARKWKALTTFWDIFFCISYGIAILACFIVNLAVNKTLSWFFIVLSALLLSASFLNFPKLIKKYRLITITLMQLVCLFLLVGVCCIYTKGNWFLLASNWILLGFAIVFVPIYIKHYNLPQVIKKHSALFSVLFDYLLLLIAGIITQGYCKSIGNSQNWYLNIFLPISAFVFVSFVLAFTLIIRYAKLNRWLKSSLCLWVSAIFTLICYPVTGFVLKLNGIEQEKLYFPNFAVWEVDMIDSNVLALLVATLLVLAVVFMAIGLTKNKKKKHLD